MMTSTAGKRESEGFSASCSILIDAAQTLSQ
jgi:hypothetical protein